MCDRTSELASRPRFARVTALLLLGLAFMTLVPPWEETFQQPGTARSTRPVGYALIFLPPAHRGIPSEAAIADFNAWQESQVTRQDLLYEFPRFAPSIDSRWGMRIDLGRLALQCIGLAAAGGAIVLVGLRSRSS